MPLDPEAQRFIDKVNAQNLPPVETLPLEKLRELFEEVFSYKDKAPIKEIIEQSIPGPLGPIPIKIYIPKTEGPHPVFISIHGGGWVAGSFKTNDALARETCYLADSVVVSVAYRRSPEFKFPAPLNDCFAAVEWVEKNIAQFGGDPKRMAVGGDSAGGNLAAAVTLMAKTKGIPRFKAQVLLYPVTNHNFDTPSYRQYGDGYLLRREAMKWYWGRYLKHEADGQNPLASPLQAKDLANLPPALFIQAEYDPLRDDGLLYAKRLKEAGVAVEVKVYDTIHGFVEFATGFNLGKKALVEMAAFLRREFGVR